MSREYLSHDTEFQVESKLGTIWLKPQAADVIYVNLNQGDRALVVNGVVYRCSGHFELVGGAWKLRHRLYAVRRDTFNVDATSAARKKILEAFQTAVETWAAANPEALREAERTDLNNQAYRLEEELRGLNTKVAGLEADLAVIRGKENRL
jgi:hypothetical protein